MEAAVNPSVADLLSAAALAENISCELAVAAEKLSQQGKTQAVRPLLEEARRHTLEALRLRSQAGSTLERANKWKPCHPEHFG
jgi:hypothetical protein